MNSVFSGLQGVFQDGLVASAQQGLYSPFGSRNKSVINGKIAFAPQPPRGRAPPPPNNGLYNTKTS